MGLKFDYSGFSKARELIEKKLREKDDEIGRRLLFMGELLCNHARTITPGHSTGGYDDITHNLRSSIGFRIFRDGEVYAEGGFQSVGGQQGEEEARKALDNADDIPANGWCIVIVVGMNYAGAVEAKGYNVLHLTEVEMMKQLDKLKKELKG